MDVYLHDQFVLSAGGAETPDGFRTHEHGGWVLTTAPSLPVVALMRGGERAGWLLGWPGRNGAPVRDQYLLSADVEDSLYELTGRWAAILTGEHPRIYVDSIASLATVYDGEARKAGATTTALRWGTPANRSAERYASRTLRPNGYYPAGLTSDPEIRRVLPNHYLDLRTWTTHRHWKPAPVAGDTPDLVDDVLTGTRESLAAAAKVAPLILPITAGRDSRMVLAAAKPLLVDAEFVTFQYPDWRRTDAQFARAIARQYNLRHTVVPLRDVGDKPKRTYLEHVGYDANEGKARDFLVAAGTLPRDRTWITGFAGEIGRAYFWKRGEGYLDADGLLSRLSLPPNPVTVGAVTAWLDNLPAGLTPEGMLDLAYVEHRTGAWASPQLYGTAQFKANIVPMASRRTITAMLSLPVEYRREQRMAEDVTRLGWPEISALPYGRVPGVIGRVQAAVSRTEAFAGRAQRKVKRMLAR